MPELDSLGEARYINLETYRKNGTSVRTPVWTARLEDDLVVFTNRNSYKVKRLRRNSRVRVAQCGVRGALKGPWHDATGRVVTDSSAENAAYKALRRKYGWQMALADLSGRLGRTKKDWVILAIRLD